MKGNTLKNRIIGVGSALLLAVGSSAMFAPAASAYVARWHM